MALYPGGSKSYVAPKATLQEVYEVIEALQGMMSTGQGGGLAKQAGDGKMAWVPFFNHLGLLSGVDLKCLEA